MPEDRARYEVRWFRHDGANLQPVDSIELVDEQSARTCVRLLPDSIVGGAALKIVPAADKALPPRIEILERFGKVPDDLA